MIGPLMTVPEGYSRGSGGAHDGRLMVIGNVRCVYCRGYLLGAAMGIGTRTRH